MPRAVVLLIALGLSLCGAACQRDADVPAKPVQSTSSTNTKVAVLPAPEKPAGALASNNTNFDGVVADVTEFRRKGGVLTALVTLRNQGPNLGIVDIGFADTYVIAEGAKKYEVLKDENGAFIASTPARISEGLVSGRTMTLWMKFPAPPGEVRMATLVVPNMPPFEDLPIQDQ